MKEFEDICREYNRTAEEVEDDLRYILKQKMAKKSIRLNAEKDYYCALVELLNNIRCLDDKSPDSTVTHEGTRLINRGYIIYDYESPKRQAERKLQRERLSLLIGFLGIIVGIAGLFLPRQDTVCQPIREFSKIESVTQQDTINLTHQIDEISQQADSTEQQNDSCKSK